MRWHPAPSDWTDNLLTRQYERPPGPLSGLAFGKPSRRSTFDNVSVFLDLSHVETPFFIFGDLIFTPLYFLSQLRKESLDSVCLNFNKWRSFFKTFKKL